VRGERGAQDRRDVAFAQDDDRARRRSRRRRIDDQQPIRIGEIRHKAEPERSAVEDFDLRFEAVSGQQAVDEPHAGTVIAQENISDPTTVVFTGRAGWIYSR